jgi:hypothetical protein
VVLKNVRVYTSSIKRKSLRVSQSQKKLSGLRISGQRKKNADGRAVKKETLKSSDLRVCV